VAGSLDALTSVNGFEKTGVAVEGVKETGAEAETPVMLVAVTVAVWWVPMMAGAM
jgi:hypothetical protein